MKRALVVLLLLALCAGPALPAQASSHCATRAASIEGSAVEITLCAGASHAVSSAAGKVVTVDLEQQFKAPKGSFAQTGPVEFLAGAAVSRAILDVAIDKLGIAKTLHMTLTLKDGRVTLEHAMLLPGAIPVL